jgi:hypothetical protein
MLSTRCSGLAKPDTTSSSGVIDPREMRDGSKQCSATVMAVCGGLQFRPTVISSYRFRISSAITTLVCFGFTTFIFLLRLFLLRLSPLTSASASAIHTKPKTNTSPTLPFPNPPKHWLYSQSTTVSHSFGKLSIGNGFGYRTTPALGSARTFGKLFGFANGFGFIAPQGEINPGIGNG